MQYNPGVMNSESIRKPVFVSIKCRYNWTCLWSNPSQNSLEQLTKQVKNKRFQYYLQSDVLECAGCNQELREGQALVALDRQWHVWCFKCQSCQTVLHGEYMGRDGQPYCEKDYQKLFGVKCAYCSRFISGKVLQESINQSHQQ